MELDDGVGVAALLVHRRPHVPHRVAALLHDGVRGGQLYRHVLFQLTVSQGVERVLRSTSHINHVFLLVSVRASFYHFANLQQYLQQYLESAGNPLSMEI